MSQIKYLNYNLQNDVQVVTNQVYKRIIFSKLLKIHFSIIKLNGVKLIQTKQM
jgi:hypothetical protein